jgi:hypothetical protein
LEFLESTTQGVMNIMPVTLQNPGEIEGKRRLDHIASVSLFIIDESHNLRNRTGKRFEQIINWIKNNPKAHVLLVTATPINNQLNDIVNQILLGAYYGLIRTLIPGTSGQRNGIIRTP